MPAGFLTRLCADFSGYRPADGSRLGVVLADLASALFAHALEDERVLSPEAHRRTLVLRIRAFIGRHLHDPDLSTQAEPVGPTAPCPTMSPTEETPSPESS
ncbi:hypothetical protein ACQPZP_17995 [Spirillospora sp. CA-142024]|uniref:hypothetical protein n=1 Tax=Spirillospora sp. CA-142024 TaxID=3240036 RepID=UPI003D9000FD